MVSRLGVMVASLPLTEQNLILTGYTGPGQPRLGREIAERLSLPFVEFERLIEARAGEDVEVIRAQYGERRLQTIESELMEEVALQRSAVIRIGGSTLMYSDHFSRLDRTGPVICLVASLGAILQRLHLAMGARYHDPAERAYMLGLLKRAWAIRDLPGIYEVDTTYLADDQIIDAVINLWQSVAISRG
jgi:shikimate kinase